MEPTRLRPEIDLAAFSLAFHLEGIKEIIFSQLLSMN